MKKILLLLLISLTICYPVPDGQPHSFDFEGDRFVLDGQPFKFAACEVHYPRIPKEYWEQRLLMSKALGCNVISAYVFWNYHEELPGVYDFETGNRNLGDFLLTAQRLNLWVFIRPGPYVCAEWDAGGHPWWLFKEENIQLRTTDKLYTNHVARYVTKLSDILYPHQSHLGGNIILLQIENEYGYRITDEGWPLMLKQMWDNSILKLKYYQAEPVTGIRGTHIEGVAIGINPGISQEAFDQARYVDSNVPIFSSETWLGWFTHWGDTEWGHQKLSDTIKQVSFLVQNDYSFSIYMAHGGTSFGFWAGANFDQHYQPDIGSYDYDSAINEAGQPAEKFFKIREIIKPWALWEVPEIPQQIAFIDIPEFSLQVVGNLFAAANTVVRSPIPNPLSFEQLDQKFGLILYTATFGSIMQDAYLTISEVHDYAQVYINGNFIGNLERRLNQTSLHIDGNYPGVNVLYILVEGLGRINFDAFIYDRKGIVSTVSLVQDQTITPVTNWTHRGIPLDAPWQIQDNSCSFCGSSPLKGHFFRKSLFLEQVGDTYLDLSKWAKGYVWVNGNNLGRFWQIGPQKHLYCPGTFLKVGLNDIFVLDLESAVPQSITGVRTLL